MMFQTESNVVKAFPTVQSEIGLREDQMGTAGALLAPYPSRINLLTVYNNTFYCSFFVFIYLTITGKKPVLAHGNKK